MSNNLDDDDYAEKLEALLLKLNRDKQFQFALRCAERTSHYCKPFDTNGVTRRALDLAKNKTNVATNEFVRLKKEVGLVLSLASETYELTERANSVWTASPKGVAAAKADYAASSISHVLLAILDEEAHELTCAYAAALAWAATFGDDDERQWQEDLLNELTSQ